MTTVRRYTFYLLLTIIFGGFFLFLSYYLSIIFKISFVKFIYAVIVAIILYIIYEITSRTLNKNLSNTYDERKIKYIQYLLRLLFIVIIVVAIPWILGVDLSGLAYGSLFISIILGLAAQTVLANLFAGILLIVVRPFKIGDRVVINTWQYGAIIPSYPPKYFSRDLMEASYYRGIVRDITLNYITLELESGRLVKLPNNIVIQAAITLENEYVWVQARYEIPKYIEFDNIKDKIIMEIKKLTTRDLSITIDETTLNTYIILIKGRFEGRDPDIIRSEILQNVMKIVEPLKKSN